jgi:hypothetical protein
MKAPENIRRASSGIVPTGLSLGTVHCAVFDAHRELPQTPSHSRPDPHSSQKDMIRITMPPFESYMPLVIQIEHDGGVSRTENQWRPSEQHTTIDQHIMGCTRSLNRHAKVSIKPGRQGGSRLARAAV